MSSHRHHPHAADAVAPSGGGTVTSSPAAATAATAISSAASALPAPLSMAELENTARNGKKKLYWSAFEVVIATTGASADAPVQEARYDAYQVNHNQLKKIHAGARGASSVRVECKYCKNPRFTQSITVSTKKFEEHYMTLHALDALASGSSSSSGGGQPSLRSGQQSAATIAVADKGDAHSKRQRGSTASETHVPEDTKRRRRSKQERDQAGAAAAAAAVVALSTSASPAAASSATSPVPNRAPAQVPVRSVDGRVTLDAADSDTKRAKKSYWTAYDVVVTESVPATDAGAAPGALETRETRQDAWRVNHNALRRMHLDERDAVSVRVECRFCANPKFSQSITVSTKKFEQHYLLEHGGGDPCALEPIAPEPMDTADIKSSRSVAPRRRRSWKVLKRGSGSASDAVGTVEKSSSRVFESLIDWLVRDGHALSTIESDAFRAYVRALNASYEPPSAAALRQRVVAECAAATTELKRLLQQERAAGTKMTLTLDSFAFASTQPRLQPQVQQLHVAVTVHFVSHQWEHTRLVLAVRAVPAPAGMNEVRALLSAIQDEFGLLGGVVAVVAASDRDGSGVVADAVTSLWPTVPTSSLTKSAASVPVRLHCAARTLDAIVDSAVDALVPLVQVAETYAAAHALDVSAVAPACRWVEKYELLLAVLQHHEHFGDDGAIATAIDRGHLSPRLSAGDVELLRLTTNALAPFTRVALDMGEASYPSMPMVFQYFRHLKETTTALLASEATSTSSKGNASIVRTFGGRLRDATEVRYRELVHTDALVPYVLDPRFRMTHVARDDQERIRKSILAVVCSVSDSDNHKDVADDEHEALAATGAANDGHAGVRRSFFEELSTSSVAVSSAFSSALPSPGNKLPSRSASTLPPSSSPSPSDELDAYLRMDNEPFAVDILEWWQQRYGQFPTLALIARQYLGVVGTSIDAAGLFSVSGWQRTMRRSALELHALEPVVVAGAFRERASRRRGAQIPGNASASVNGASSAAAVSELRASDEFACII